MAIYHASLKAVQRSAGRSATSAAAYRAACKIVDTRTGEVHNYARKGGVLHAEMLLPGGQAPDRAEFWNRIETHHKRRDAIVARELVVAIPAELGRDEQIRLARQMAVALAKQYSVGVDVCVHEPSAGGDDRNTYAHILMSACLVDQAGALGKKCEPLDPIHCARRKLPSAAEWVRPVWECLANEVLASAGHEARIDHRSHKARGLNEVPGQHHGPAVTNMLRRGAASDVAQRQADEAALTGAAVLARQLADAQATADRLAKLAALAEADVLAATERSPACF